MADDGADELISTASDGVQDLADAAVAVLAQAGPAGVLAQPVVEALRNVWEGYFGSPLAEGGTNWNAYSHQELYDMLWQGADVGDVGRVADEWQRHGTELTGHADGLRDQRGALERNWDGQAARQASGALGDLGERTGAAGSRAGAVGRATREAGDALESARNEMPPPGVDPVAAGSAGSAAGTAVGTVVGGALGAGAAGVGAGPGAMMGAAVGGIAGGAGSAFLASVAAAEQKAQAVHVMQRYEQCLAGSSRNITSASAGAGGAAEAGEEPAATTAAGFGASSAAGTGGGFGGASGGGVPWGKLVGGGPLDAALAPGGRAGIGGAAGRFGGAALGASPAGRSGGRGGMAPAGAGARGRDEESGEHRNRLPVVDQRLFDVDEPVMPPVIGE
ncbi:WXG100 family type VII secretion target [Saccharopolyspora sp. 6V]|uniref:WXG100 family type VII secretion target n=1 Tax=Saccharopolyspora sp. 6V TaxID=2877239 RepID=UPI001CD579A9|nr:hypothetical protein [Saccharopolyspora sp. 6V]MCA1194926.1 hypothetical protein [Saccharopolyspora sp. 6V]